MANKNRITLEVFYHEKYCYCNTQHRNIYFNFSDTVQSSVYYGKMLVMINNDTFTFTENSKNCSALLQF